MPRRVCAVGLKDNPHRATRRAECTVACSSRSLWLSPRSLLPTQQPARSCALVTRANAGVVTYDKLDASATNFGIDAGYSMPMNPEKTFEVCPIASFDFQSGPNSKTTNPSTDFSSNAFGLGGMIGSTRS